jgi:hypothetical protein
MLKKWMASGAHLWLFTKVAKLGFFRWILLPFTLLTAPWIYALRLEYFDTTVFLSGFAVICTFVIPFTLTALQHFPRQEATAFIAVEVRSGLIGIHIWKQFPSKSEMQELLQCSVTAAQSAGIQTLSIQSPIFVKAGRLDAWRRLLRQSLNAQGYVDAYIEVIPPKNLDFFRSIFFNITRYIGNFDGRGKHLPKFTGFLVPSAGFKVKL